MRSIISKRLHIGLTFDVPSHYVPINRYHTHKKAVGEFAPISFSITVHLAFGYQKSTFAREKSSERTNEKKTATPTQIDQSNLSSLLMIFQVLC